MQTNQKSDSDKIKSAIVILRKNLNESWLYYCIEHELHLQYLSLHPSNPNSFLDGDYAACIRTSILTLAELLLKNNNSINIRY
ncbi:MAG: hypothetical protein MUO77_15020, partial [Anaerolineales bacterium]|nr:hypothetical protein [Anaerolineales bacterium]